MEVIDKHHPQFDTIRWLALATSKDNGKPSLKTINVREDKATATNGYVLNQYNYENDVHQLFGLPPRLYEVTKLTKTEVHLIPSDRHFPDTDSIWPDLEIYKQVTLKGHVYDKYHSDINLAIDFCQVIRSMKNDGAIKYDLFKIAAENSDMNRAYVDPERGLSAVVLKNKVRESLIMPIRL